MTVHAHEMMNLARLKQITAVGKLTNLPNANSILITIIHENVPFAMIGKKSPVKKDARKNTSVEHPCQPNGNVTTPRVTYKVTDEKTMEWCSVDSVSYID